MKLQIGELAKQTGVSVRTLHHYDTIGLLKPSEVDPITGYRFYNETSMKKLKEILYYRELHFPLKEIAETTQIPTRKTLTNRLTPKHH